MKVGHTIANGIALVSLIAFGAIPTFAQPRGKGPGPGMDPERRIEMHIGFLEEQLSLTDDQSQTIREILEVSHKEAATWNDEHPDASREDRRSFRNEHRAAIDAEILEVLNDDQKVIFEELKEAGGPHGRSFRGGPKMGGMGARLNLNAAQRTRLHAIHRALLEEADTWRSENPNATAEERAAFRERHRARRIELMADVLSKAQMEQMAHRGPRGRGARRGGHVLARALHRLDLSQEQREALAEMRDERRTELGTWLDDHPDAGCEERRAFRAEQFDDVKATLAETLTPEQLAELVGILATHRGRRFERHGRHPWK